MVLRQYDILPALAHVHPPGEVLSRGLEGVAAQLDGAVGAAAGGEHRVEALQRDVEEGAHVIPDGEGAYAAHGVVILIISMHISKVLMNS